MCIVSGGNTRTRASMTRSHPRIFPSKCCYIWKASKETLPLIEDIMTIHKFEVRKNIALKCATYERSLKKYRLERPGYEPVTVKCALYTAVCSINWDMEKSEFILCIQNFNCQVELIDVKEITEVNCATYAIAKEACKQIQ